MNKLVSILFAGVLAFFCLGNSDDGSGCERKSGVDDNKTAFSEQHETEVNQQHLFSVQPPPKLTWSMERDNIIKREVLFNDRSVFFYMYVFIEGVSQPIGYYQVNKVSSVDSQLTNTMQIVRPDNYEHSTQVIPSPAEDGSYGTNGSGVFGFTPEDVYIEHNMKYIVSSIPLTFAHPVTRLAIVETDEARQMLNNSKKVMAVKH